MSLEFGSPRKAAVLLASLEPAMAASLLRQMDPEEAEKLREQVSTLGPIDPAEQQAVIDEFFQIGPAPAEAELDHGGVELELSAESAYAEPLHEPGPTRVRSNSLEHPFAALRHASPRDLVKIPALEHPQTVALIISHLPDSHAAEVLANLSTGQRRQVIDRLMRLEQPSQEVLRDVEQELLLRMAREEQESRKRDSGVDLLGRILDAADAHSERAILSQLAAHNPRLAEELGLEPAQAASLDELDDELLVAAFDAAEPHVARLALAGLSERCHARVVRGLPAARVRQLERFLGQLGPTTLADIETAQRMVLQLAARMATGELVDAPLRSRLRLAA